MPLGVLLETGYYKAGGKYSLCVGRHPDCHNTVVRAHSCGVETRGLFV